MNPRPAKQVRVRFAPSPTGFWHIGSARTTFFNWLYAKKHNGKFILRIEDTDLERNRPEFEADIFEGMKWLGLNWDEGPIPGSKEYKGDFGPYRQMERLPLYQKYLKKMADKHQTYPCFCTKEELEQHRQAMLTGGQAAVYSGKCRALSADEVRDRQQKGMSSVIRVKVPSGTIMFEDQIRGKVSFESSVIGDFVIAKDHSAPLFLFSNVVDDFEMKITHVIRGEEHLANTPRQLILQEMLGFSHLVYAHVPLILNPDRSKMSKRFAATSVAEYRKAGYLPQAILNFLLLLGWHPPGNQEVFTLAEMAEQFDLTRIQKGGAIFNIQKLDWFNGHYLRSLPPKELLEILKREMLEKHIEMLRLEGIEIPDDEKLLKMLEAVKDRMEKLPDFLALTGFFFKMPQYDPGLLIWKTSTAAAAAAHIEFVATLLEGVPDTEFSKEDLEKLIMKYAEEKGRGDVLWPVRVALSGSRASPGPFDIMNVLGKHESLLRLEFALTKLNEMSS